MTSLVVLLGSLECIARLATTSTTVHVSSNASVTNGTFALLMTTPALDDAFRSASNRASWSSNPSPVYPTNEFFCSGA